MCWPWNLDEKQQLNVYDPENGPHLNIQALTADKTSIMITARLKTVEHGPEFTGALDQSHVLSRTTSDLLAKTRYLQ